MKIIKTCMQCGNEIEDDIKFNNTLTCSKCGSGDIDQLAELKYEDITIEEILEEYENNNIEFECHADEKEIEFVEE